MIQQNIQHVNTTNWDTVYKQTRNQK